MRYGAKYRQVKYAIPKTYREILFSKLPGQNEGAKINAAWAKFMAYKGSTGDDLSEKTFRRLLSSGKSRGGQQDGLRQIARWARDQYHIDELLEYDWEVLEDHEPSPNEPDVERLLALVEDAEPHLGDPDHESMARIDRHQADIQVALQKAEPFEKLRMAAALRKYWYARERYAEGRKSLESALAECPEASLERAKALSGLAGYLCLQADFARARTLCQDSLAISESGLPAFSGPKAIEIAAEAYRSLGVATLHAGETAEAERLFRESLRRYKDAESDLWLQVNVMNNIGAALNEQKRYGEAVEICDETANWAHGMGYRHGRSVALTNQGVALIYLREWEKALPICRLGARLQKKNSRPHAHSLVNLGIVLTELDRLGEAASSLKNSMNAFRRLKTSDGSRPSKEWRVIVDVIGEVGALQCRAAEYGNGVEIIASSEQARKELGCPLPENEASRIDAYVARARSALGERAFIGHRYAGERIKKEEALEIAISLCDDLAQS